MLFRANDIMDVTTYKCFGRLRSCFLGRFCGHRQGEEKVQNVHNFAKYVAPGALLMLRSAHGAHAFLYTVIDPCDFRGFELLAVCEVINSVIIARKYPEPMQF